MLFLLCVSVVEEGKDKKAVTYYEVSEKGQIMRGPECQAMKFGPNP